MFCSSLVVLCGLLILQEEPITKVKLPQEVRQELAKTPDDDIAGKQWNRWTSRSFVVCSIDDGQARFLNANLEKVKSWIYTRWGLSDIPFTAEARLICVNDREFFKKLFGLDRTKVEVRKDQSGKINLSVIFFLLDDKPSRTVPTPLTELCLDEFEQKYGFQVGWWASRDGSVERYFAGHQTTIDWAYRSPTP